MRIKAPENVSAATITDLEQAILFQDVDLDTLNRLLQHCRICQIERRQELCLERRDGKYIYVIRRGYVAIRSKAFALTWDNFLAWRGPGQVLGEIEILSQKPNSPIIKATDPCELIEIRAKPFLSVADSSPFIYRNLARLIVEKNVHAWRRSEIIQIPLSSALRRIARTLMMLIEERGYDEGSRIIKGSIRQIDIAGYIGTRRETVMENMAELREAGILRYEENKIEILNEERLNNEV